MKPESQKSISHSPISRRTVLRGTSAAVTLPFLECMIGSTLGDEKLEQPPVRVAFMFKPNGVFPSSWTPPGSDEDFELKTRYLAPFANVKDQMILLENLWHRKTVGRNGHWPKVPAWLSGGFVERTTGRDIDTGHVSLDQLLARKIGSRTPLPSIELGIDSPRTGVDNVGGGFARIYGNHIAWRDSHTPVPNEIVPRMAFDRLFRSGPAPSLNRLRLKGDAAQKSILRDLPSVLDATMESAKTLNPKFSNSDRRKLDEYFESIRSVERRIDASMKPMARWKNEKQIVLERPEDGIPPDHETHVRLMLDILILAFWTDSTRIATFMFGNAQSGKNYSFLRGVQGSYHGISHHRNDQKMVEQYQRIGIWHSHQMAYLLDKMKKLDEGNGSLLDNSMILYGSSIRDGNSHQEKNLPLVLFGKAGGQIKSGRRLVSPKETPFCNLFVSMADKTGVRLKQFGDSQGKVDLG